MTILLFKTARQNDVPLVVAVFRHSATPPPCQSARSAGSGSVLSQLSETAGGEATPCQGKVEMSHSQQSRNVRFCRGGRDGVVVCDCPCRGRAWRGGPRPMRRSWLRKIGIPPSGDEPLVIRGSWSSGFGFQVFLLSRFYWRSFGAEALRPFQRECCRGAFARLSLWTVLAHPSDSALRAPELCAACQTLGPLRRSKFFPQSLPLGLGAALRVAGAEVFWMVTFAAGAQTVELR